MMLLYTLLLNYVCVRPHTQLRLVSYFILHIQGLFYSSFGNEIYFSAVFFSSCVQSAYLVYFLQSFLLFLAEGYLKPAFLIQIDH